MMMFKPQLVSAGSEVHQQLIQWISPINANAEKVGLEGNPLAKTPVLQTLQEEEVHKLLPWSGHPGNETCFITQVALEQNVDAIFFITGYHRGFESVISPPSKKMIADWERLIAKPSYIKQLAEHNEEIPKMQARVNAAMEEINADRARRGQPPRVLDQRWGLYSNAGELGLAWETPHPGSDPGYQLVKDSDVSKYFRKLVDELYENKEKPVPSVNVILFLAGDEAFSKGEEKLLDQYVRFFRGKKRVIRGEDEIKRARSSKESKN